MTDAERRIAESAVIFFAGPVAERRARRPNAAGWVTFTSEKRRLAIHESAHAVVSALAGRFVHELSIIPDPECRATRGDYSVGGVCFVTDSAAPRARERTHTFMRDASMIAGFAWLLAFDAPAPRWKAMHALVRTWREAARRIVGAHWILILSLASELERRGSMRLAETEQFLQRLREPGRGVPPFAAA